MVYTLNSPLRVALSSKRDWILNLNNYRNTHYQTLNKTKVSYTSMMEKDIQSLPELNKIKVKYILFPKTKRLCDLNNVLCIHSKYFLDALQKFGKIPDDDYKHVITESFHFGEVDKDNPRVEIEIDEVT